MNGIPPYQLANARMQDFQFLRSPSSNSNLHPRSGIGAAALTAFAGLLTNIINNGMNQHAINAQNAYNKPAAQMARYRAAGLNPHLIYSQGNAGNQQQIAQYQAPDLSSLLGAGSGLMMNESQMELQRHQAENMKEQNSLLRAQTTAQLLNNKWIDSEKKAQIANIEADSFLKGEQKKLTQMQTSYTAQELQNKQQELLESQSRVKVNNAQEQLLKSQKNLADVDWYVKNKVKDDEVRRLIAMADLAETQKDYEAFAAEWYKNIGYPKEKASQGWVNALMDELRLFLESAGVSQKDGLIRGVINYFKNRKDIEGNDNYRRQHNVPDSVRGSGTTW